MLQLDPYPALFVIGLFKPTFKIRDSGLSRRIAGLPNVL